MSKAYPITRVLLVVILSLPMLVGCGGKDEGGGTTADAETAATAEDVITSYRQAWNAGASNDLENFYDSGLRFEIPADLDKACARIGWDPLNLPKLAEGKVSGGPSEKAVSYPVGPDSLDVKLENRNVGWVIVSVTPNVKLNLKPINDVVAAFEKAWNNNNIDAVYKFLTPSMYKKTKSFDKLFARRGWTNQLPKISTPAVEKSKDEEYRTTFFIGDAGELQLKWIVEGGRWGLRTLKPPKAD